MNNIEHVPLFQKGVMIGIREHYNKLVMLASKFVLLIL